ncbi:putative toxin-antitoxin system toxin component, PIN family [Candidatus Bathyarchaeota archaeon]|jgi:putative PIN family toxin of toxin-antitoxin system|nr:MAG: putative toxin-antitoxin system toxin component, PIN family [Candidatus Bathyarchaeota archaeon]
MSGKNTRAFLDANTILCGLLFKGNEATLLELGRVRAIEHVTNHIVMEEVSAVLKRKEFDHILDEVKGLIKYLHACLSLMDNPSHETINQHFNLLNDKKDIPVALGAQHADYLVTGDKELLEKIPNAITTRKLLEKTLPKSQ